MSTNSSGSNSIKPTGEEERQSNIALGSSKKLKNQKRNSRASLGMIDFMGIKNTDDIENFYEIDKVIGRGKF